MNSQQRCRLFVAYLIDIARWKVKFCSARNWGEGSILPVVAISFDQFKSDRRLLVYQFVSRSVPPNSLRMSGLFALTIPFVILTICLLLITPQAWRVSIAICLTFFIRLSSKSFDLPTFLMRKFETPALHFFLLIIHWSSNKRKFQILYGNDNVPNVRNLFLILLWTTMWFINFVYRKPQLNIRAFFRSGRDNFCEGYFFSFLSIFTFFIFIFIRFEVSYRLPFR